MFILFLKYEKIRKSKNIDTYIFKVINLNINITKKNC